MPALPEAARAGVWSTYMGTLSSENDPLPGISKAELRAAVDAVDDWVVANQSSYNSALPNPFRTNATAAQKARLLMFVVDRRFIEGV